MVLAKCPICNIELTEDDSHCNSIDESFGMTVSFNKIGHCPKCEKEYQWLVCYDLENALIEDLSEV